MNPQIFVWFLYAFWLILITYLIVAAIGVKQDTEGHWLQSFGHQGRVLGLMQSGASLGRCTRIHIAGCRLPRKIKRANDALDLVPEPA